MTDDTPRPMSNIAYSIDYMTPQGIRRVTSTDKAKIERINDALRKQGKATLLTMRSVR